MKRIRRLGAIAAAKDECKMGQCFMTAVRPPSKTIKMTIFVLVAFLLEVIHAQFIFPPSTEPCPSDSNIIGYTTIAAMNADMQTEISRIDGGGDFEDGQTYNMILCPGGTFDTTDEPLLPVLNGAIFSCGEDGNVADGCVVSGGRQNVNIQAPSINNYPLQMISFNGITFEMFGDRSIEIQGTPDLDAVFTNSVWQVCYLAVTSSRC